MSLINLWIVAVLRLVVEYVEKALDVRLLLPRQGRKRSKHISGVDKWSYKLGIGQGRHSCISSVDWMLGSAFPVRVLIDHLFGLMMVS